MKFKTKLKKLIVTTGVLFMLGLAATTTAYAAGPGTQDTHTQSQTPAQSDRWEGTGDTWRVKTPDNNGYLTNSWFQDTDNSWYMLGNDGVMFSGLITDQSTGKSYLLNTQHDGTYGRMLTVDGVYNVNGSQVHLQFNQQHDGTFGAITSGLTEVRNSGVQETSLVAIPSDSANNTNNTGSSKADNKPTQETTGERKTVLDDPGVRGNGNDAGCKPDSNHFSGGLSSH